MANPMHMTLCKPTICKCVRGTQFDRDNCIGHAHELAVIMYTQYIGSSAAANADCTSVVEGMFTIFTPYIGEIDIDTFAKYTHEPYTFSSTVCNIIRLCKTYRPQTKSHDVIIDLRNPTNFNNFRTMRNIIQTECDGIDINNEDAYDRLKSMYSHRPERRDILALYLRWAYIYNTVTTAYNRVVRNNMSTTSLPYTPGISTPSTSSAAITTPYTPAVIMRGKFANIRNALDKMRIVVGQTPNRQTPSAQQNKNNSPIPFPLSTVTPQPPSPEHTSPLYTNTATNMGSNDKNNPLDVVSDTYTIRTQSELDGYTNITVKYIHLTIKNYVDHKAKLLPKDAAYKICDIIYNLGLLIDLDIYAGLSHVVWLEGIQNIFKDMRDNLYNDVYKTITISHIYWIYIVCAKWMARVKNMRDKHYAILVYTDMVRMLVNIKEQNILIVYPILDDINGYIIANGSTFLQQPLEAAKQDGVISFETVCKHLSEQSLSYKDTSVIFLLDAFFASRKTALKYHDTIFEFAVDLICAYNNIDRHSDNIILQLTDIYNKDIQTITGIYSDIKIADWIAEYSDYMFSINVLHIHNVHLYTIQGDVQTQLDTFQSRFNKINDFAVNIAGISPKLFIPSNVDMAELKRHLDENPAINHKNIITYLRNVSNTNKVSLRIQPPPTTNTDEDDATRPADSQAESITFASEITISESTPSTDNIAAVRSNTNSINGDTASEDTATISDGRVTSNANNADGSVGHENQHPQPTVPTTPVVTTFPTARAPAAELTFSTPMSDNVTVRDQAIVPLSHDQTDGLISPIATDARFDGATANDMRGTADIYTNNDGNNHDSMRNVSTEHATYAIPVDGALSESTIAHGSVENVNLPNKDITPDMYRWITNEYKPYILGDLPFPFMVYQLLVYTIPWTDISEKDMAAIRDVSVMIYNILHDTYGTLSVDNMIDSLTDRYTRIRVNSSHKKQYELYMLQYIHTSLALKYYGWFTSRKRQNHTDDTRILSNLQQLIQQLFTTADTTLYDMSPFNIQIQTYGDMDKSVIEYCKQVISDYDKTKDLVLYYIIDPINHDNGVKESQHDASRDGDDDDSVEQSVKTTTKPVRIRHNPNWFRPQ